MVKSEWIIDLECIWGARSVSVGMKGMGWMKQKEGIEPKWAFLFLLFPPGTSTATHPRTAKMFFPASCDCVLVPSTRDRSVQMQTGWLVEYDSRHRHTTAHGSAEQRQGQSQRQGSNMFLCMNMPLQVCVVDRSIPR